MIVSVSTRRRVGGSWPRPAAARQVIGDGPEHHRRHERQRADQEHRPQQHPGERQVVGPQRARGLRARASSARGTRRPPAAGSAAGNRPSSRTIPVAMFQAGLLSRQPLEARAVVGRRRGELVEDLAEAVRAGVGHGRLAPARSPRTAPAPQQIRSGWIRMASIASLTSLASTFLPRYSGVRPDHQPGEEHGDDDVHQHVLEARADAAEDDVEHHQSPSAPARRSG